MQFVPGLALLQLICTGLPAWDRVKRVVHVKSLRPFSGEIKPFFIFSRKKSCKGEEVKLSFGENRKSIALSILEIFEFELCENRLSAVKVAKESSTRV